MALRPCLDCGSPSMNSRCPVHKAQREARRDAVRGSTTQRGLGWSHQQQVAELKLRRPLGHCPRCGRRITARNPLTGEHGTARAHGGTKVTDLICRICNSADGARIRVF